MGEFRDRELEKYLKALLHPKFASLYLRFLDDKIF